MIRSETMKKIKVFLKIVLFFAVFIGGQAGIKYAILDDTMTISRVMLHDLYTEKENIDILFCGASHCQLGFDTAVLDEAFGQNTFNAGSSSQGLETSLAMIREAAAYHDLKQVYVDLDYAIVTRELPNLESIYIISDYMKPSVRKAEYLLNATTSEYYVNSFMPLHKGRGYTKNPAEIVRIIGKKMKSGYWNYTDIDSSYAGKGYIASRTVIPEGSLWTTETPEAKDFMIPDNQQQYLREIISFCKENNIQLTFVSVPVTDFNMALVENYDDYVQTIKDFLAEYDIAYVDFNLARPQVSGIDRDSYFNDDNHLNQDGARVFAQCFAGYMKGNIGDSELFYVSYEKKKQMEEPKVLGVRIEKAGEDITAIPMVNNHGIVPECEVKRTEEGYLITVQVDGKITNQIEIKDEELR